MSRYGRFEGVDEAVELNVVAARQDCNGPSPTNQGISSLLFLSPSREE
jgi:hypothetical protein